MERAKQHLPSARVGKYALTERTQALHCKDLGEGDVIVFKVKIHNQSHGQIRIGRALWACCYY